MKLTKLDIGLIGFLAVLLPTMVAGGWYILNNEPPPKETATALKVPEEATEAIEAVVDEMTARLPDFSGSTTELAWSKVKTVLVKPDGTMWQRVWRDDGASLLIPYRMRKGSP